MVATFQKDDPNRPICKECELPMHRNGIAESGRTRYRCKGCGTRTTGSAESQHLSQKVGYDVDEVIDLLQRSLLQGDLTLPEGLTKESFVDD